MVSVTDRIKEVRQPRGGYVNPTSFTVVDMEGGGLLPIHDENVPPRLVGLAVDYLTRSLVYREPLDAFYVSLTGAAMIDERDMATDLAMAVVDLSPQSIRNACQLAGYDVCFRAGVDLYKPVADILPDSVTTDHIRCMVERSLRFFDRYGPVIEDGVTFAGGYTPTVDSGDGDFLTRGTLWDFKVSVSAPTKEHTLQLLIYYLLGRHSNDENLRAVERLGIFNPRLNRVYVINVCEIWDEVIRAVETDVIGYH
jgi:hypothetical protein